MGKVNRVPVQDTLIQLGIECVIRGIVKRAARVGLSGTCLAALASCGVAVGSQSSAAVGSVMPAVTGLRLDVARSDIKRAGFESDVEILGGGTFGVIVDANWLVCEQLPKAGEALTSPRLTVDRECPNLNPTPPAVGLITDESPTSSPESLVPVATEPPLPTMGTAPSTPPPTMALIPAAPTFAPVDPAPPPAPVDVYFANCDEARAAGMAPLFQGQPGYRRGLDRDHDGIACDVTG